MFKYYIWLIKIKTLFFEYFPDDSCETIKFIFYFAENRLTVFMRKFQIIQLHDIVLCGVYLWDIRLCDFSIQKKKLNHTAVIMEESSKSMKKIFTTLKLNSFYAFHSYKIFIFVLIEKLSSILYVTCM